MDAAVSGLSGVRAAATPAPPSTDRSNDVVMATTQPTNDACARACFKALGSEEEALTGEEREAKKQKFQALVVEERD